MYLIPLTVANNSLGEGFGQSYFFAFFLVFKKDAFMSFLEAPFARNSTSALDM